MFHFENLWIRQKNFDLEEIKIANKDLVRKVHKLQIHGMDLEESSRSGSNLL